MQSKKVVRDMRVGALEGDNYSRRADEIFQYIFCDHWHSLFCNCIINIAPPLQAKNPCQSAHLNDEHGATAH